MIAIEEIKQIHKDNLPSVLVLAGEDIGQYSQLKQALFEQIGFDASDLAYSYFDLTETPFEAASMDLESLPFFADEKIILFDNVLDITTQKKNVLDEADFKKLEAYLENPLETNRLILLAPGKLDGKRRMVKLLKRDAVILEASPVKEADLRRYFSAEAARLGLQMEASVFQQLLEKSNFDFAEVAKNLSFLQSYKKDGQIRAIDIQMAIPKTLQDNIFELSQYLLTSRIDQARNLARDLRLQGEDDIKLIAVLLNQFRLFLQVKLLQKQVGSEQQIVVALSDLLGRKVNPYQVKFALRDSRNLSISYLTSAISELIRTDYQIKTGQFEKEYLFDLALIKLAAGENC